MKNYRSEHTWMKDVDEIDLLVYGLRRIFGYDYWYGENHNEFGVSYHHHGQDMIRSSIASDETEVGIREECDE